MEEVPPNWRDFRSTRNLRLNFYHEEACYYEPRSSTDVFEGLRRREENQRRK